MIHLHNENVNVTLKAQGAELTSWEVFGTELLWQGDPTYWGRQAPILFPFVGRLLDDRYLYDGSTYTMSQHGFARDELFELVASSDTHARFKLQATTETRTHYPFQFELFVEYRLIGEELTITYHVHNRDDVPLPFSIGGHPAFNIPFAGGAFEDYTIDFGETRPLDRLLLEGPYLTGAYQPLGERRYIPLTHSLFDQDALIFENVEYAALRHEPTGRAIVMECPSFTHFGIWSPPKSDAPFVCLEPWFGHADYTGHRKDIRQKEDMQLLAPNETFEATYTLYLET
ncbi:aldose 1-epimerase family protein [Exiguobacterium sp.]|uniref:aldose 1-epimerase family protein n=1 Tax=Exiguobacterium sp. TaxID=44751 RepID=UPI00263B1E18|nr:aldose 1-epimerase family protein [Exiguobacterium sp.]MCC5891510.1 aldose 1-epimerase family protein [Exiguobacterium sp.]